MLYTYISQTDDVYANLATEYTLSQKVMGNDQILFLWSNKKTVVIGAHQNAAAEVNCAALAAEGGKLARRFSGGGAVYHDENNLCFSFICAAEIYCVKQNYDIILAALKRFGVSATLTGRNDLQVGQQKFSGNAYYTKNGVTVHHGTLLINTDVDAMNRFLTVSNSKLSSHGVKSVTARVINLATLNAAINRQTLTESILNCAGQSMPLSLKEQDKQTIACQAKFFCSDKWLYGFEKYDNNLTGSFAWGQVQLAYTVRGGVITSAMLYTDCLDVEAVNAARQMLLGQNPLAPSNARGNTIYNDVITLFNT